MADTEALFANARSLLARRARSHHGDPDLLDIARDLLAEAERLRGQRDYYRRRWLVHGVRYPHHLGYWRDKYVATVMECLARARAKDA